MRNVLNAKSLVFFYVFLLLVGSAIPLGNGTQSILMDNYTLDIRWDYLLHALVYLPLPYLLFFGLRALGNGKGGGTVRGVAIWIALLSVLIPVLFEVLQMLIPYRSFNVNDLMANCFGVMLGWVVVLVLKR